jgi:zinc transport system ATP-binding protein
VCFDYEGYEVLHKINLQVPKGDFVGIIGPNGSGKTTLMKIVLGTLSPAEGKVKVFGKDPKKFRETRLLGYVPQRYEIDKSFPGNVREILSLKKGDAKKAATLLGVEKMMERKFVDLSPGLQQRVLIAASMMSNPKILVLDEPTVGVDIRAQQEFYKLLKKINQELGITILLVTHEVGMIPDHVKSVVCINQKVCCSGRADETPKLLRQIYGDQVHMFKHE